MKSLEHIETALDNLRTALAVEGIQLKRILVDKTLDLKYELINGRRPTELPRTPCDPFTSLCIADTIIVGMDNERLRNHKEWPDDGQEV